MGDQPNQEPEITTYAAEAEVARAIFYDLAEPDEQFEDLDEETAAGITSSARAAMKAHLAWLKEAGFRIAPPGMMLRPKTASDAAAMIRAGQEFLEAQMRKPGLVGGAAPLVRPDGSRLQ